MITDFASLAASLKPNFAANSNDNESESTGWKEPSFNVTFRESISKPARGPFSVSYTHLTLPTKRIV